MDLKRITPQKLVWMDLEMTGLVPAKDRILEVAVIVTDWDFHELETFESGVGHNPKIIESLLDANAFFNQFADTKAQLLQLSTQSPNEEEVQAQLTALIRRHFAEGSPALLAGNSIHQDRQFIRQWWPEVEKTLHYRMLDVSSWKVVLQGKYQVSFDKTEKHRALDDIRESIAELQYYLRWFGAEGDVPHAHA